MSEKISALTITLSKAGIVSRPFVSYKKMSSLLVQYSDSGWFTCQLYPGSFQNEDRCVLSSHSITAQDPTRCLSVVGISNCSTIGVLTSWSMAQITWFRNRTDLGLLVVPSGMTTARVRGSVFNLANIISPCPAFPQRLSTQLSKKEW